MAKLKEETVYVLVVEHFSGTLTEILGVFNSLEEAKSLQRTYDSMTRISVTIYRTSLFSSAPTKKVKSGKTSKKA